MEIKNQMIEILCITAEHEYWEKTIQFAESCSWKAGSFLAKKMSEKSFQDWEREFCAVIDGKIAGFCTFAKKDEWPESYEYSPFKGLL